MVVSTHEQFLLQDRREGADGWDAYEWVHSFLGWASIGPIDMQDIFYLAWQVVLSGFPKILID